MEVSVFTSSQMGKTGLRFGELKLCFSKNCSSGTRISSPKSADRICFDQRINWRKAGLRLAVKSVQSEPVHRSNRVSTKSIPLDRVRLFVGLPLDSVSSCNNVVHGRAIAAGLKALKLMGVEGVELPIFWGIVENQAMGKYEWSGYLAIAEMVKTAGLKLQIDLRFHASTEPEISLPKWVCRIGESNPSIFFTDRIGQQYRECLSLGVDDIPVLDGKTPTQVYQEFCESFKVAFSPFLGSTITGISMGLGPDGELRYPSLRGQPANSKSLGAGEFQCYDEHMLKLLHQHAESAGNPLWGLGGPHDVPRYNDDSPISSNFFKENGGSWESQYGNFFLSWYSNLLLSHADRLLSLASSTFRDTPVEVSGKVPILHPWYKSRSHPSELTAGFYNTDKINGYEAVAKMFAKNSCQMRLAGMELADENQPPEALSSPELLLAQIKRACRNHGVEILGQNSVISGVSSGFEQIKKNLSGENVVDLFTYQRMGAYFFSPEHFPSFTEFVRSLSQPEPCFDDRPLVEERKAEVPNRSLESETQLLQAA